MGSKKSQKNRINKQEQPSQRPELALVLQGMFQKLNEKYGSTGSFKNGTIFIQGVPEEKYEEAETFIKKSLKKKGIKTGSVSKIQKDHKYNLIVRTEA